MHSTLYRRSALTSTRAWSRPNQLRPGRSSPVSRKGSSVPVVGTYESTSVWRPHGVCSLVHTYIATKCEVISFSTEEFHSPMAGEAPRGSKFHSSRTISSYPITHHHSSLSSQCTGWNHFRFPCLCSHHCVRYLDEYKQVEYIRFL
jgi:hypothetical protein